MPEQNQKKNERPRLERGVKIPERQVIYEKVERRRQPHTYSTTNIIMTTEQADRLLMDVWDRAWDRTREFRMGILDSQLSVDGVRVPGELSQDGLARIVNTMLNAFEDELRFEWGIVNRVEVE